MNRLRRIVLAAAVTGLVGGERPASAVDFGLGLFKRRQTKADAPQSRAKQLVEILRTDPDEDKRIAAATELKGLDPRNNPEIIPGLMASLQKDPSPAVRIEAVKALGDLKPVSERRQTLLAQMGFRFGINGPHAARMKAIAGP